MPVFTIRTNVPGTSVPEGFHKEMTELLAATVKKPSKFFWVILLAGQDMTLGGSTDPCAISYLESIDLDTPDHVPMDTITPVLIESLSEKLGVQKARCVISYKHVTQDHIGKHIPPAKQ